MDAGDLAEWAIAAAGVAGAAGCMAYAVRGRSSALLAPSIYRGDRSRASLALTFDDGPSESTPALLEILAAHHVRATFFMCGKNVRRLPRIAQEVRLAGHEIGNHTDTHPRMHFKPPEFIYRELALAQETIKIKVGVTPRYFRAPYGVRWFGLRRAQERLGLTGVMWTVIGQDWKWPAARIAQRLLDGASNGGILCLHDGRTTRHTPDIRPTLDAVEAALPQLQERGFKFETVSEILSSAELTARVMDVIARTQKLPPESLTGDSTFAELKIDSLDSINILFALENEFGIDIPDDATKRIHSVRDAVEGVETLLAAKS